MEELLKKLNEMLEQAKKDCGRPFLSEYEQGCNAGRLDMIEDVIRLVEQSK